MGSVVIIVGVTFIAFLTAVVTSLFVEEEQKTHRTVMEDAQRAYQDETRRLLEDVSVACRRSRRCCGTCRASAADIAPSRVPASFVSHLLRRLALAGDPPEAGPQPEDFVVQGRPAQPVTFYFESRWNRAIRPSPSC